MNFWIVPFFGFCTYPPPLADHVMKKKRFSFFEEGLLILLFRGRKLSTPPPTLSLVLFPLNGRAWRGGFSEVQYDTKEINKCPECFRQQPDGKKSDAARPSAHTRKAPAALLTKHSTNRSQPPTTGSADQSIR